MAERAKRGGVRLYRAAEAATLGDVPVFRTPELDETALYGLGKYDPYVGTVFRVLFGHPDQPGMSLVHLKYAPGYRLARHSHDVDCLYFVLKGEACLGNQVLVAGDGFFTPAGAPYTYTAGPEGVEVLEFRGTGSVGTTFHESAKGWDALVEYVESNRERWTVGAGAQ